MSVAQRKCPLCDTLTDSAVCPQDRMATLLVAANASRVPMPELGHVIAGRYEVARLIGRGGFGSVFAARHLGTGQEVALKILEPPEDADDALAVKRFFLEARVTSGLRHPNTVRVFDFGQDDSGLVYLALELLTGRTLRQELKRRKSEARVFTEAEAIAVGLAVTRSLGEAHAAGLVHRDLKPDNIFLHEVAGDDPVVKVLDFGIVKLAGGHPTLSTPTSVPGTPAYMSPEHALSGEVDLKSDLYSLGVILYQLVSGELPFAGASDPQTLYMHAYQPAPPLLPRAKTPLSEGFVAVVARAMEKSPAARFQSAQAMREALAMASRGELLPEHVALTRSAALAEDLQLPPPTPLATETRLHPVRRRRSPLLYVAPVLVLGASLGATLWLSREPEVTVSELPDPEIREAVPAPPPARTATAARPAEPPPAATATIARPSAPPPPPRREPRPATRSRAAKQPDILHQRIEDLTK